MGNTPQGAMAAPEAALDAGWYKYGAIPGDAGSSVMAGHVLGYKGERGVFYRLNQIKIGDQLFVLDGHGQTITFSVREIRSYNQNDQPFEVFNSTDGKAHLNLITCAGDWDSSQQRYLKRLVVFADKAN